MARQVWQSEDGQVFNTEKECFDHENAWRNTASIEALRRHIFSLNVYSEATTKSSFSDEFKSLIKEGIFNESYLWNNKEDFIVLGQILQNIPSEIQVLSEDEDLDYLCGIEIGDERDEVDEDWQDPRIPDSHEGSPF